MLRSTKDEIPKSRVQDSAAKTTAMKVELLGHFLTASKHSSPVRRGDKGVSSDVFWELKTSSVRCKAAVISGLSNPKDDMEQMICEEGRGYAKYRTNHSCYCRLN